MKILLATNFLKGSLSAIETADAIKRGILKVYPMADILIIPIADGGDGTIDAIRHCTENREMVSLVNGPLDREVEARWLILERGSDKVAIIEGAQANGLSLLTPDRYNPMVTTTYGIGQLVLNALEHECTQIVVTIGGSSTNDGGVGILQALGAKFMDEEGNSLRFGGGPLENLDVIDLSGLDQRLKRVKLVVACDVDNPLCGPLGASAIYGPQKGAIPEMVNFLDRNLSHLADLTANVTGHDLRDFPGVGAAGGIGFAFKAILGADLIPGFDLVADLSSMEKKLADVDLVITTEGRLDSQSLMGKAPYQVAQLAAKYNVPTIVIAGSVERNIDLDAADITSAFSIVNGPMSLDEAIDDADFLMENITVQIMRMLRLKIL